MTGRDGDCSAAPVRRQAVGTVRLVRFCVRSAACRLPSLRPSPLPSTPSAAAPRGLVRALHRYYEARPTPRLFRGSFGSSPSCRGPGSLRATAGQTRSPRFRRDPFVRDGVFDHGRATAPRIPGPLMSPSTFPTGSSPGRSTTARSSPGSRRAGSWTRRRSGRCRRPCPGRSSRPTSQSPLPAVPSRSVAANPSRVLSSGGVLAKPAAWASPLSAWHTRMTLSRRGERCRRSRTPREPGAGHGRSRAGLAPAGRGTAFRPCLRCHRQHRQHRQPRRRGWLRHGGYLSWSRWSNCLVAL